MDTNTSDMFSIRVRFDRAHYSADDELAYVLVDVAVRPEWQPEDVSTAANGLKVPVEIVMLLDVSGSMKQPEKYPLLRRAVETMLQAPRANNW